MRKRIAVYLGEITGELQKILSKSISYYANQLGYDVVSFCTYGSYNDDYLYALGEKAGIYLPDFTMFDGVILTEDVFNLDGMADDLYKILKKKAKCPVVFMRTKRKGFYSVLAENKSAIELVTRHFIEKHGFRDICFMSGKKGAADAIERLDGFLHVMEEYNIPVTEHMVFHGDYWREKGAEAIDWFMEGRSQYPQAIICANDYMAISICEELAKRKVRVPEDVCVSGFDYVQEGKYNLPSITSLMVDFEQMSKSSVEIIDAVNRGEKQSNVEKVVPKLMLHKSCGCGKQIYVSNDSGIIQEGYNTILSMKHIMAATTEYQGVLEDEEYLWVTEKYAKLFRSDKVYLCMCDVNEEGYNAVENDSTFSERMVLKRIFRGDKRAKKLNIVFDRKDILPNEMWQKNKPGNYMVFTLHFKNIVYGYLVAEFSNEDWFDIFTQSYIMSLANAIENAAVQKKLEDLETIRALYQKDSLTGLYNRRGFDKLLKDRLALNEDESIKYFVVSIDMDGLKYINDTFGHMEGDKALIHLAEALQSVMKKNEFCARNGGDEFAAFLCGKSSRRVKEFEKDFAKELERVNSLGLAYSVQASVGVCEFYEEAEDNILSCIQKADMRMYEDKKLRKSKME